MKKIKKSTDLHLGIGASAFVQGSVPRKVYEDSDFHPTPPIATEKLLEREEFRGTVWECACGRGDMSEILSKKCYRVLSTDLIDRGYARGRGGVDFLTHKPKFKFDNVVTNPPFSLALPFAQRALSFSPQKVAMLARLSWLEGKSRRQFFETSGLARVYVFSSRINIPRFSVVDEFAGRGGMIAFAWFVWHRGHVGPATLGWL